MQTFTFYEDRFHNSRPSQGTCPHCKTAFITFLFSSVIAFSIPTSTYAETTSSFPSDVTVSYLGPEGTYTEEAAELFFAQGGKLKPEETVSDTIEQVLTGTSEYAVIPQENTIGGPVYDYVDELLSHEELTIDGEVLLPIRQALLAAEGTNLNDIKTIYSHKQGIAQSRTWLNDNLPDVEVVEVSSTAEGARMASECSDHSVAAIASTQAAKVYGLNVLAENIQQNEDNVTRFYVVSDDQPSADTSDCISFAATGDAGSLPDLLKEIDNLGLTLVSLHDRPAKTTLGQYVYVIECSGKGQNICQKIAEKCDGFSIRYLGSYPVKGQVP
ncbi:MAG: prephenate dehydratase [Clostridia bacterium]|nr:prephenate dehydratase [Clostridia bacterium]